MKAALLPAAYGIAGVDSVLRNEPLERALEREATTREYVRRSASAKRGSVSRGGLPPDAAALRREIYSMRARHKREVLRVQGLVAGNIERVSKRIATGVLCGSFVDTDCGKGAVRSFQWGAYRAPNDDNELRTDEALAMVARCVETVLWQELIRK